MKLNSLDKLFIHELKDLYSAENQLIEALPKMEAAATDDELKKAFSSHCDETKQHVARLERIFSTVDFEPGGHRCQAMAGLIEEAEGLLKEKTTSRVLDAALIAAAQRVEHYEMAGYGTARAYAEKLGKYDVADLLQETLFEESRTDNHLTRLAERSINFAAMAAG
ncbi:MAG: ferritin-like domain-containing protein [Planctomycetaceae bacterium]|nr:ferritin-like domain-containing protein [Planctomycetaceae bacterium]